MKTFADFEINIPATSANQAYVVCPKCSSDRKKKNAKPLSVNIQDGVWNCHHCQWSGSLNEKTEPKRYNQPKTESKYTKPKYQTPEKLPQKVLDYFQGRGISEEILTRNKIGYGLEWMPQAEKEVTTIQFPYFENGECVNIKYRSGEKGFKLFKGAKQTLYGYDDIENERLIWTEGEIDKLSVEVAGISSVVSVPTGAVNPNAKDLANKFIFLENCLDRLKEVKVHILAFDNDGPGNRLQEEAVRRLGPEKCKIVLFPDDCKDSNDVLVKHGAETLKGCIDQAKEVPLEGVFSVNDLVEGVCDLYREGLKPGASPGWANLYKLYSVNPGEMTIVTGIPGHGKSEVNDNMIINLAKSQGWRFGIFSPENQPLSIHCMKLLEKWNCQPFGDRSKNRMTSEEMFQGLESLQEHFYFILPNEDELTVDAILSKAKTLVSRKGIRGLIIDPWNEIDHSRPSNLSETEYISKSLTKIRRFARDYGVHVWVICHPTKLQKDAKGKFPVPSLSDCMGSSHWRNKADNGLSVWRDFEDQNGKIEVHVQKIRFKHIGKPGVAQLYYDRATGRYSETEVRVIGG